MVSPVPVLLIQQLCTASFAGLLSLGFRLFLLGGFLNFLLGVFDQVLHGVAHRQQLISQLSVNDRRSPSSAFRFAATFFMAPSLALAFFDALEPFPVFFPARILAAALLTDVLRT